MLGYAADVSTLSENGETAEPHIWLLKIHQLPVITALLRVWAKLIEPLVTTACES
jgi:hypothetical protein